MQSLLTQNLSTLICDIDFSKCYFYKTGSWITGPGMVYAKHLAAMTQSPFTNKPQSLFVTGGIGPSGDLSITEILTDNGREVFSPSLPVAIYRHCMVLMNSTAALVIGGLQNGLNSAQTFLISDSRKVKCNSPPFKINIQKFWFFIFFKRNKDKEHFAFTILKRLYSISNVSLFF